MLNRLFFVFFIIFFLFQANLSQAYNDFYKNRLIEKKSELVKRRQELKKLKQKEKKIYKEILHIQQNIQKITQSINRQNKILMNLKKDEDDLNRKIVLLKKTIKILSNDMEKILNMMWSIYLQKNYFSMRNNFKDIYLKYIWLQYIYKSYTEKLIEIKQNQEKLKAQQTKLELLKNKIKSQTKKIEAEKDKLLKEKITLFSKLQNLRVMSVKKEKQIEDIIETVEKLNYRLVLSKTKNFKMAKGLLPYPVKGKKVKRIKKGIVIYAPKGSKVNSCFSGKIVFQDKLRGFGNVVIIYHGDGYYTLYAFLSKVFVKMGQVVEGSEPIGEVGYSPFVKTYALYFELRKGKNSLNPEQWLNK